MRALRVLLFTAPTVTKLRPATTRTRLGAALASELLERRRTHWAGGVLVVLALSPIRTLSTAPRAVALRAGPLWEVTVMLHAALRAGEGAQLSVLPCPAPVFAVPGAPFLATVPLGRRSERRLAVDLHAFVVEFFAVLLAVFCRGHENQVRRFVVEGVVVLVMYVHSLRYWAVHVGEYVTMQVSSAAPARRLVVHALWPIVTAWIALVDNALEYNLRRWIHGRILSTTDALLLAYYAGARTRMRWL